MRNTKRAMMAAAVMVSAVWLYAQTPAQNPPMNPTGMPCPMMMGAPGAGPTAGHPMPHAMGAMNAEGREAMLQHMTDSLVLSEKEIDSALQAKKAELGLKDAQIKKLAAVIEASQKAKLKQHVDSMAAGQCCGGAAAQPAQPMPMDHSMHH